MYEYEISNDIDSFRYFMEMTETEFAQQVGMPRSTLHNWKTGRSTPTDSSLEMLYGYMYNCGYRINALKEQMFKDRIHKGNAVLFHGAKANIKGDVSLSFSSDDNDFGKGFYLGESLLQSASFVCNYPKASVYIAELKMEHNLKLVEFDVDTDWMLTIALFRKKLEAYKDSPLLMELARKVRTADIIRAPIADNRMFQILDEFIEGNITDLQCKSALSATDLGKQYVVISEKALKNLEIIHHCYLCEPEKKNYLADKAEFDKVSTQKVKFVKREYAGKGKYIEEVLA